MKCKTILAVHPVHDSLSDLEVHAKLARELEAHLDIVVLNIVSTMDSLLWPSAPTDDWSKGFDQRLAETRKRAKKVRHWLDSQSIGAAIHPACVDLGLIGETVAAHALCTDLVTFVASGSSFVTGMMGKAIEGALFDAGRAAIVLSPAESQRVGPARRVTIAWDRSAQAMRAIDRALPFLVDAHEVSIATIGDADDASPSSTELQAWLQRHGVSSRTLELPDTGQHAGRALLAHAERDAVDLLVMGAYHHSRLRERLFAGVTHEVLSSVAVTTLLAH